MSTDIRSAPRTGNEFPILKVCKTLGTWKPALVEVKVREVTWDSQSGAGAGSGTHLGFRTRRSSNPRFLKSWGQGREKSNLSPSLIGRRQEWLWCR